MAVAVPAPSEAVVSSAVEALGVVAAEGETFGESAGEAPGGRVAAEKGAEAAVGFVEGSWEARTIGAGRPCSFAPAAGVIERRRTGTEPEPLAEVHVSN